MARNGVSVNRGNPAYLLGGSIPPFEVYWHRYTGCGVAYVRGRTVFQVYLAYLKYYNLERDYIQCVYTLLLINKFNIFIGILRVLLLWFYRGEIDPCIPKKMRYTYSFRYTSAWRDNVTKMWHSAKPMVVQRAAHALWCNADFTHRHNMKVPMVSMVRYP